MQEHNYEKLAEALQALVDSKNYIRSIGAINGYVSNPTKPLAPTVTAHSRLLIEFGRKDPDALLRLLHLVLRIRAKDVDLETYCSENKEAIDKAFLHLNQMERPLRVVRSLIETDGDPKKAQRLLSYNGNRPLEVLLPIIRSSLTKFRMLVDKYMVIKKTEIVEAKTAYSRVYNKRRTNQKRLFCYLKRTEELSDQQKAELKEIHRRSIVASTNYAEEMFAKGTPKFEARKEFWAEYDKDLNKTLQIIEKEKQGLKINRQYIAFPEIANKYYKVNSGEVSQSKLNALKNKFKK